MIFIFFSSLDLEPPRTPTGSNCFNYTDLYFFVYFRAIVYGVYDVVLER